MKTKTGWQATAKKLIDKARKAGLMRSCAFVQPGGYDPVTEVSTPGANQNVDCFREDYEASQIDGQSIQKTDFKLLALCNDFTTVNPKTDGLKVTVDGAVCTVIFAEKDGADAVWIIQVRA